MKKFLFICLICMYSFSTIKDDDKGPATNPRHDKANQFCYEYYAYQRYNYTTSEVLEDPFWMDDDKNFNEVPKGISECVDSLLWDPYKERYNDRCCFIRLQVDGEMHAGCIGLTEEQFMDTTETIRRIEAGDKNLWTSASKGSKVYQLDCASSYLKVLYVASFLVAFLL